VVDLPVVDTIGAGDAFHGALLAWLEKKGKMSRSALAELTELELYNALFFANKAASIVCSRQGAEPPTRKEVDALKIPELKVMPQPVPVVKKKADVAKTAKPAAAKKAGVAKKKK
jgi:fructokinase